MFGKVKLLFFCPTPPPFHGSNYMVKQLIDALKNHEEFDIKHIDIRFSNDIKGLQKFTIKKALLFVKYLLKLIFIGITFRPNYIIMIPAFHRNPFIINYIYVFFASLILKRNVILWIHSNNIKSTYDNSGLVFKKAIKNIFALSKLIVPCAYKLSELNYNFFSPTDKIKPIPNGIPVEVRNKTRNSEKIQITYLSNMDISKGWKVLFEAAEIICKEYEKVNFAFYGNPTNSSPKESIELLFSSSSYSDRIKYYGPAYNEEKIKVLSSTDIFCLPSFYEAFPLSILEAMAYGLPVITTNQGGISEAIVNGKGGLIVEKNDVIDLVEKLKMLIYDAALRKAMGDFNRKKYLQNFTYQAFIRNWENLLKSVSDEK